MLCHLIISMYNIQIFSHRDDFPHYNSLREERFNDIKIRKWSISLRRRLKTMIRFHMRAFPFLKRGHPSEIEQRDQRQPTSGRHTGYSVTATCELFVPVSRVTSRQSLGIISWVERDEANERPGTPVRRPRFHFHYEADAKRFAYAHSLSFIHT